MRRSTCYPPSCPPPTVNSPRQNQDRRLRAKLKAAEISRETPVTQAVRKQVRYSRHLHKTKINKSVTYSRCLPKLLPHHPFMSHSESHLSRVNCAGLVTFAALCMNSCVCFPSQTRAPDPNQAQEVTRNFQKTRFGQRRLENYIGRWGNKHPKLFKQIT